MSANNCKSGQLKKVFSRNLRSPIILTKNGVAERANRTILEKMRTMLLAANLKKSLWPLAYLWAIQLKNQSPRFALPEVTPTQALHGRIPNLRHLRVFGCVAYVHIPQEKWG